MSTPEFTHEDAKALIQRLKLTLFDASRNNAALHYKASRLKFSLAQVNSNPPSLAHISRALFTNEGLSLKTLFGSVFYTLHTELFNELRLKSLRQERELGLSFLNLAFGLLHWKEPNSDKPITSPLLFLPIRLVRLKDQENEFFISLRDEETSVNPWLKQVVQAQFKLPLASKVLLTEEAIVEFFTELQVALKANLNKGLADWTLNTSEVLLGNFNYRKVSLLNDYETLAENTHYVERVRDLFAVKNTIKPSASPFGIEQFYPILPFDSSQEQILKMARTGAHFILQGPPGTGKSQTIVQLLADYAVQGKKVLFVCSKSAALNVVQKRLQQAGLQILCARINDAKTDKTNFIAELKSVFTNDFSSESSSLDWALRRAKGLLHLDYELQDLQSNALLLQQFMPDLGMRLLDFLDYVAENSFSEIVLPSDTVIPTFSEFTAARSSLDMLKQEAEYLGRATFKEACTLILANLNVIQFKNVELSELAAKLKALHAFCEESMKYAAIFEFNTLNFNDLLELKQVVDRLLSFGELEILAKFLSPKSSEFKLLKSTFTKREKNTKKRNTLSKFKIDLLAEPSEEELSELLETHKLIPKGFKKFFCASYYRFANKVKRYSLCNWQSFALQLQLRADLIQLDREVEVLKKTLSDYPFGGNVQDLLLFQAALSKAGKTELILKLSKLKAKQLAELKGYLLRFYTHYYQLNAEFGGDLQQIEKRLKAICTFAENPHFLAILRSLSPLNQAVLRCLEHNPQLLFNLEALCVWQTLQLLKEKHPLLNTFSSKQVNAQLPRLTGQFQNIYQANSKFIAQQYSEKLAKNLEVASVKTKKSEVNSFTKGYQLAKKLSKQQRPTQSLRDLISGETAVFVSDVKPIHLTNPSALSEVYALDLPLVDAVIFDEASQVLLADALPAMLRAKQCIVVGDDMQLPPSRFFSKNDMLETKANATQNLLNAFASRWPQLSLNYHYRSQHTSLIAYSNASYYKNSLKYAPDLPNKVSANNFFTIPGGEPPTNALSALKLAGISYHHQENSSYLNQENVQEAAYVAKLVAAYVKSNRHLSLGVVCFSKTQQRAVRKQVKLLAERDLAFALYLESAEEKLTDAGVESLFIKNLENVQGDERDCIIVSTAYAKNSAGKLNLQFGPVNQSGGEKRLNVLFTRARKHLALVTSLLPNAISSENQGLKHLNMYLNYAFLQSTGMQSKALAFVNTETKESAEKNKNSTVSGVCAFIETLGYRCYLEPTNPFSFSLLVVENKVNSNQTIGICIDEHNHGQCESIVQSVVFNGQQMKQKAWEIHWLLQKDWLLYRAESKAYLQEMLKAL